MRWGVDLWGTLWGDGTKDVQVAVSKPIANDIAGDVTMTIMAGFNLTLANSFSFTGAISAESISDGSGYSLTYPGGTSNAHNRVNTTYSTAAAGSPTYSSHSAGSTVWS